MQQDRRTKETWDAIFAIATFGSYALTPESITGTSLVMKLTIQQLMTYRVSDYWLNSFLINFMRMKRPYKYLEVG